MKIDLKDYLNRKCKITLKNDKTYIATVKYNKVVSSYFVCLSGNRQLLDYYPNGLNVYTPSLDIIHIEELTMNTEQILEEISKTQDQLNKLQAELKKAEEKEKFNKKFFTPIEHEKEYQSCLKLLKTKNISYIIECFAWDKTPQGVGYWEDISDNVTHLAEYDIHQIKDWVINYLIRKS